MSSGSAGPATACSSTGRGRSAFHHPLVGGLTLAYESLDLPADAGLTIVNYSAEAGSASEAALHELARWTSTRAKLSAVQAESRV